MSTAPATRKPNDYKSDLKPIWCPGCGDFGVLASLYRAFAQLNLDPAKTVVVSGIGCSSRLPGFVSTYGVHTLHGRALPVAMGVKLANPELTVVAVGGDGDGFAIGAGHFPHAARRNIDITYLVMDNEIYGLTKGQASPTSRRGTRTPSTPGGSVDAPLSALRLALGAGARFVARGIDTQQKVLPDILRRAHAHKGAALVEIIQNCIVYNDGAFDGFARKDVEAEAQLHLRHGEPLVYGKGRDKGLRLAGGLRLEVTAADDPAVLRHDERSPLLAMLLAMLEPPMPVAIGVIYDDPAEASWEAAMRPALEAAGPGLDEVMRQGATWTRAEPRAE